MIDDAIKSVAEDALANKSKKELSHLVLLLGVSLFVVGGALITLKVNADKKSRETMESSIQVLTKGVSTLNQTVVNGFETQDKKIDKLKDDNKLQHQAIDKKLELLKTHTDQQTRKQMDLIDEIVNMKATSQATPQRNVYMENLQIKYNDNYTLNNEILKELKPTSDTIKKNDNSTDI